MRETEEETAGAAKASRPAAAPAARATSSPSPVENIKRVTGASSSGIVLDYIGAATLDDDPPLLEVVGAATV